MGENLRIICVVTNIDISIKAEVGYGSKGGNA
jgi:hypothetical protein